MTGPASAKSANQRPAKSRAARTAVDSAIDTSITALRAIQDGNYRVELPTADNLEKEQLHRAIRELATVLHARQELHQDEIRRLITKSSAAVEDERRRIAAEIHDHLNAVLIFVQLEAQRATELSAQLADSDVVQQIREILQRMAATTADLYVAGRTIVKQLRPEVIDTLGLTSALNDLIRSLQQVHPHCRFNLRVEPGFPQLNKDLTIATYRMVQEALTNVVKHAAASHAEVSLWRNSKRATVCVTIEDDGRGFDVKKSAKSGIGLIAMRERATGLGGNLKLNSVPDYGAKVVIELPMR